MGLEINRGNTLAHEFVQFAIESGVLKFGQFKTKAGRMSPYFFNAGLFDDGAKLGRLAQFYARQLLLEEKTTGLQFDMLFGPAYKGIPLAAAVSIELARMGRNLPFAYNRKEAKDHGEGGTLVGAPVQGRVLIVDDVMSAGTAAKESIAIIKAAGAVPHAVARYGAYLGKNVVLMPSYVNIGAYVDEGTMVDTWATVGSCAQIFTYDGISTTFLAR